MAKKSSSRKTTAKKGARKKKTTGPRRPSGGRRDASQLDLHPLIEHIQNLIEQLERKKQAAPRGLAAAEDTAESTVDRLKGAKQLFEDICHPDMAIPI